MEKLRVEYGGRTVAVRTARGMTHGQLRDEAVRLLGVPLSPSELLLQVSTCRGCAICGMIEVICCRQHGGHALQAIRSSGGSGGPTPVLLLAAWRGCEHDAHSLHGDQNSAPRIFSTYNPNRMNMVHSAQWAPQSLLPRDRLLPQQPQGHAPSHWFEVRNEQAQARWRRTPHTSARPRAVAQAPCPRPPGLPVPARGLGVGTPVHPPRRVALRSALR
jgi:hypothetical protein